MPMSCPACSGDLIPVEARNHYGTRLVLDTCLQCHGYWLESMEPVGVGFDSIQVLEGDADLTQVVTAPREDFRPCPACGTALEEVTGGTIPEGLHLDTCRTCRGMWFDRGELLVYKSALEAKRKKMQSEEFQQAQKRQRQKRVVAAGAFGRTGWTAHTVRAALDGLADLDL